MYKISLKVSRKNYRCINNVNASCHIFKKGENIKGNYNKYKIQLINFIKTNQKDVRFLAFLH